MSFQTVKKGFSTGMLLQLAVGPVFFFIVMLVLHHGILNGFYAVCAVVLVDYIFIILAVLGIGKLMEHKTVKNILTYLGALFLIGFGIYSIIPNLISSGGYELGIPEQNPSAFLKAFFLTASNPLTIVFWTSLFASKAAELSLTKKQLWLFGFSAGLASLTFLGLSVTCVSIFRKSIPGYVVPWMNIFVGVVLIVFGLKAIIRHIGGHSS